MTFKQKGRSSPIQLLNAQQLQQQSDRLKVFEPKKKLIDSDEKRGGGGDRKYINLFSAVEQKKLGFKPPKVSQADIIPGVRSGSP